MNSRLFAENWRPLRQEIAFASRAGFGAVQISVREDRHATPSLLGDSFASLAEQLHEANLTAVMELNILVGLDGLLPNGETPLDVLHHHLPAITTLPCTAVHWHLTLSAQDKQADPAAIAQLEQRLTPLFADGVTLGEKHQFAFGFEHNAPAHTLLATPEACAALLKRVPGLGFVWDFNHTAEASFDAFAALAPRLSMLHIADTAWPQLNYHWPLGMGNLPLERFVAAVRQAGFTGVGILEIGGLPESGGYGRDTDEALRASRAYWEALA